MEDFTLILLFIYPTGRNEMKVLFRSVSKIDFFVDWLNDGLRLREEVTGANENL